MTLCALWDSTNFWELDSVEVEGGWRCSQMIEFPVREKGIWTVLSAEPDVDFVLPVTTKPFFPPEEVMTKFTVSDLFAMAQDLRHGMVWVWDSTGKWAIDQVPVEGRRRRSQSAFDYDAILMPHFTWPGRRPILW